MEDRAADNVIVHRTGAEMSGSALAHQLRSPAPARLGSVVSYVAASCVGPPDDSGQIGAARVGRSDTEAFSSVVHRDMTIHLSIVAKVATGLELDNLLDQKTSCRHNREQLQAPRTQLRRDWSLLDQGQTAYDLARRVGSEACSERSHLCAGRSAPATLMTTPQGSHSVHWGRGCNRAAPFLAPISARNNLLGQDEPGVQNRRGVVCAMS